MTVADPPSQRAADAFRRLLEQDPSGSRQELEEIRQRMRRDNLLVGDDVVPLCFGPALVSDSRLAPIRTETSRLMRILIHLEPILHRPRWMELLGISPQERDLIRLPASLPPGSHVSRVDGFLGAPSADDSGFRVVELNIDSPGGAAYLDASWDMLSATETWKKFKKLHPGRYLRCDRPILDVLLRSWRRWGGSGSPRVAIVDWITVSTVSEFNVLRDRFKRAGVDTVVSDPRELEFRNGRLLDYDGRPIDLVYRRVLVEDLLARGEEAQALLDAYRHGAICMVNPFRAKPLTIKSLLALFHRPEIEELVDADDVQFLRRIVPWTAIVEDGPVLEPLRRRREHLVLKPADGWGGQGIFLGWELSESDWDRALEQAVRGRYVAQERVFIPQADCPVAVDGGWKYLPFRLDFDPYFFSRRMGTPLMRLSSNDMLNVKTGGQVAVTWVLKG
ncbi:MAG: hypothetical protein AB1758_35390 [Candidatus Eremiobacterota bacterium]